MARLVGQTTSPKNKFRLHSSNNDNNNKVYFTSTSDESHNMFQNDTNLWHHRLGHISFSRLSHVPGINLRPSSLDTSICVTCSLAKHTNLPFSLTEHSCHIPFGLIRMDIWGPYRVCTHNQCRYFLTIVDYCTRATWTYLLKYKSQAFATLEMFCHYASNQFGYVVEIVRSDNVLEFDTSECQNFFSKHEIVHQASCVNKP